VGSRGIRPVGSVILSGCYRDTLAHVTVMSPRPISARGLLGYRQPSPSLGPPLLSLSLSPPPPWGMVEPAGHPSAFWAGVTGAFVVGVGAYDGELDEPHAVSAPRAMIEQTRSAKSGRIKRILTRFPFLTGQRVSRRYSAAW
jgi:hypothetical protein